MSRQTKTLPSPSLPHAKPFRSTAMSLGGRTWDKRISLRQLWPGALFRLFEVSTCVLLGPAMAVEPTLAEKWEGDVGLRARARNIGRLTQWQIKDNVELTGVPNMHSTVLNVRCLELLAEWYCHQIRVPVSIPIDVLREQACWLFNFLFLKKIKRTLAIDQIQVRKPFFGMQLLSSQVEEWRKLSGLQPNIGQVTLDAWGLKRLLSYVMRRWMTGAITPREACRTFFWILLVKSPFERTF